MVPPAPNSSSSGCGVKTRIVFPSNSSIGTFGCSAHAAAASANIAQNSASFFMESVPPPPYRYIPPSGGAGVYPENVRPGGERRSEALDLTLVRFAVVCRGAYQGGRARGGVPLNALPDRAAPRRRPRGRSAA